MRVGSIELMISEGREQKRKGWETAVRIENILCMVLHEVHGRQVEEMMDALSEGPEGFYG